MQDYTKKMFVVLDLETTGLTPGSDKIMEYAFLKIDPTTFEILDQLDGFVNPEIPIPEMISGITHIFDEDVKNAPRFSEIAPKIQEFLQDSVLVGHNISFDISFLIAQGIEIRKDISIDTFFLANIFCFGLSSLNLGYLAQYFHIPLHDAHRAGDDTKATYLLLKKLLEILHEKSKVYGSMLYELFFYSQEPGLKILAQLYLEEYKDKSFEVFESFRLFQKEKMIHSELTKIGEKLVDFSEFFKKSPDLEMRESQKDMIDIVDKTLRFGKKSFIEAPTGIGKTFAYLLPALQFAKKSGEKIHISTSTKALQDQIFYKDLSYFSSIFPNSFSYTKLKGKRNYVSILRLGEFYENISGKSSEIGFFLKLYFWLYETELGELDELNYYGEEYGFLHEIDASSFEVLSDSNPFLEGEFLYQARKRAKNSDIIVTNNHILFQDAISEGFILGGVKNLIVDEAHALEDVVTQSLRRNLSYESLIKAFSRLEQRMKKKKYSSIEYNILKDQILYTCSDIFSHFEDNFYQKDGNIQKQILLQKKHKEFLKEIQISTEKVCDFFQDLHTLLHAKNFRDEGFDALYYIQFFQDFILNFNPDFHICSLSIQESGAIEMNMTLLSPGNFLQEHIWKNLSSCILTSATLQMQGSFEYISTILSAKDFETYILQTSFDYKKQSLLYVPNDLGNVKYKSEKIFEFLYDFFRIVRGNTLLLCTSFQMIREVFTRYKILLEQDGIQLLAQSISGSKYKQIETFKQQSDHSILLGTDSFWEGVDIPGEDLKYLLVHKIPFMVPTDPVFIARSRLFSNGFQQYAIPKAVLKLKQGFGRLIRTKQDVGIIVFLDDRIYTTDWGKFIFDAFPIDIPVKYGDGNSFLKLLGERERPKK